MTPTGRARQHAILAGIATAVLFGAGNAIWALDMPDGGAPVAEVVGFYRDTADRIVAGGSLSVVALAAFVWFAAAMRQLLADSGGDPVLGTTAFGGAVVTTAAGLGAETINMSAALRARDGELSDALAQSLFEVSQALGSVASGAGVGLFALATGASALRSGLLPRWLAAALAIAGLALLTPLSSINWLPGAALVVITAWVAGDLWRTGRARQVS
jgi:Domain of unknown function (DUF4386)